MKIAKRILLFNLILACLLLMLMKLSQKFDKIYEKEKIVIDGLKKKSDYIRAIAVGNSHNRGLDFNVLNINGYHIWQGGNDVFEVQYQIENIVPLLHELKIVFYCAPYYLFRWDNACSKNIDRKEIRRKYYYHFRKNSWVEGDLKNYLLSLLSPLIKPDHFKGVISGIIYPGKKTVKEKKGYFIASDGARRDPINFTFKEKDELLIYVSEYILPRVLNIIVDMNNECPDIEKRVLEQLEETINYLSQKNISLIFYTPPYYCSYTKNFDEEILFSMKKNMDKLVKKYGIEYYNFNDNKVLTKDHTLYRDGHHLNLLYGSDKFSKHFKEKLHMIQRSGNEKSNSWF